MSFSIQTNVSSLVAQENLRVNSEFQSRTIARLTSGFRINSSGDDAAGLAVANKFRSDIAELAQGVRNANDGLSTLQIIDGGANNISKILDRMKTLATQSASTTFSGSRATLNSEFSALVTEIDRQASNVGMQTGGKYAGKISVYIGGGNSQSNAQVSVDLTGGQIDATGLGVNSSSVAAGGMTSAAQAMSAAQVLTVDVDGQTYTVTSKTAAAAGSTAKVIDDLNEQFVSKGVALSASLQGTDVVFSSSKGFRVQGEAVANGVIASGAVVLNTGVYNKEGTATFADAAADENITITTAAGTRSVAIGAALTTQAQVISAFNAIGKELGVYAFAAADGNGVHFASSTSFSLTATGGADDTGMVSGVGANVVTVTADAPTETATVNYNALNAVKSITSAIERLGNTQGKVGTAQNKLTYAIQLANSQVASFSAAESRIRDADVAAEASNLTKAQVLQQASMAAMAQANSAPQAVLSLLRG